MNRKIKFRVWNKGKNQWVHGPGHEPNILGETILLGGFCIVPVAQLNDLEVLQYTGLDDKDGKEIYEGDIISGEFFDTEYHHAETIKHEVVFNNGAYNIASSNWHKPTLEIIGNIFENPELLKKYEKPRFTKR